MTTRLKTSLIILAVLLLSIILAVLLLSNGSFASRCTDEERDRMEKYSFGYSADEAYAFGKNIQAMIKDKDLETLFSFVEGELSAGPRRSFIQGKEFDDLFSQEWSEYMLSQIPECTPYGWRGFYLGNIAYNNLDGNWFIDSIGGANQEKIDTGNIPIGWKVQGELLPGQCFIERCGPCGDYLGFATQFKIADLEDFELNPGKYLSGEAHSPRGMINSFEPILPYARDGGMSIVRYVDECLNYGSPPKITEKGRIKNNVGGGVMEGGREYEYDVLVEINLDKCQELAPNLKAKCESAFLISIGEYAGGSIGWRYQYNIYGVFQLPEGRSIVAPLKNFYIYNDALNYLDEIN